MADTLPDIIRQLDSITPTSLGDDDPVELGNLNNVINSIGKLTKLCKMLKNWDCPGVGGKYFRYPRREITNSGITKVLEEDPEPSEIWPETAWINISEFYPGAFFRVEGGLAASFGEEMQTHALGQHEHKLIHGDYLSFPGSTGPEQDQAGAAETRADRNATSGLVSVGNYAEETRPDNYTIQIWQRIS